MLMQDDSDDSDLDDSTYNNFFFWNNWNPGSLLNCAKSFTEQTGRETKRSLYKNRPLPVGNWIPPDNFGMKKVLHEKISKNYEFQAEEVALVERDNNTIPTISGLQVNETLGNDNAIEFDWNEDWGRRCSNLSQIEEGEVWNLVHPGIFGIFKLFVKDGIVAAYAEAEYVCPETMDKVMIVTTREDHIQKLLCIPHNEWIAVIESLKLLKECVTYDASKKCDWQKGSSLQQLWHVICRRRLWLPSVSLLLKRCGVKKMTQFLQIRPKFVVLNVRGYNGRIIPDQE